MEIIRRDSTTSHPALPPVSVDELPVLLPKADTSTCIQDSIPFELQDITATMISSSFKRENLPYFHMPHCRYPFLWFQLQQNSVEELSLLAAFLSSYGCWYWLKNPISLQG